MSSDIGLLDKLEFSDWLEYVDLCDFNFENMPLCFGSLPRYLIYRGMIDLINLIFQLSQYIL